MYIDGGMTRIYKDGVEVDGREKGGSAVAIDPSVSVAIGSQPSDAFASDSGHVAKFFDGLIDMDKRTLEFIQTNKGNPASHSGMDTPSKDNEDLRWLVEHFWSKERTLR